jgi:hypothetical protein
LSKIPVFNKKYGSVINSKHQKLLLRTGKVSQVVDRLPNKLEAASSNPSAAKKRKTAFEKAEMLDLVKKASKPLFKILPKKETILRKVK